MLNLLDNLEHVNVIDRWFNVCKRGGYIIELNHAVSFVGNHLYPQYKADPQLKEKVKLIFSYSL